VTSADALCPEHVAVSVAWPSAFPTKRPVPAEVAVLGSLDVHTASMLTLAEPALALQTTVSPASIVDAPHVSASPEPGEGALGAVGTTLPHAAAIDRAALRPADAPPWHVSVPKTRKAHYER
jgi:hypothetical protein